MTGGGGGSQEGGLGVFLLPFLGFQAINSLQCCQR